MSLVGPAVGGSTMTGRGGGWRAFISPLALVLSIGGCDGCSEKETRSQAVPTPDFGLGGGAPASTADTEGAAAPVAGTTASARGSGGAVCKTVCGRTHECNLEAAQKLAKTGNPYATGTLKRLERGADARLEDCQKTCDTGSITKERADAMDACLRMAGCAEFLTCVSD